MHDIPTEILNAALTVERWFKENNIENWQLAGIEVRDYDPDWCEYVPPTPEELQRERDKLAQYYRELRAVDPAKARSKWYLDKSWKRMNAAQIKWATDKMLEHASPIRVLYKFFNHSVSKTHIV